MDYADIASEYEQGFTELAIQGLPKPKASTGFCIAQGCEEPTRGLFCGPDCRDAHEREARRKAH